jgi:hypothetical protein
LDKSHLPSHPRLYEINTLPWLRLLSQRLGRPVTLGNVPAREWDAIRDWGFDLVWLMGVWKRSPQARSIALRTTELFASFQAATPDWKAEDVIGSAFSVASYEPDPAAGSWEDLREARLRLHQRGMLLILDFVGNHTAPDHPWAETHVERYLLGSPQDYQRNPSLFTPLREKPALFVARGKDPYFPPWTDTLQLDYFNPETRAALMAELRNLSRCCDGLRCDMAMLSLNRVFAQTWSGILKREPPSTEFWAEATFSLPHMLWIAEAYWGTEAEMLRLGFDYAYDKVLYDRLRYAEGRDLRPLLSADPLLQKKGVRFLENHDEARSVDAFPPDRLRAAILLLATLPGMKLFYDGQFEGCRLRLPVQLLKCLPPSEDPALKDYYRRVLGLADHHCFRKGNWQLLPVHAAGDTGQEDLLAYSWRYQSLCKLVVVNFSPRSAQGRVTLPDVASDGDYVFFDELSSEGYHRKGAEIRQRGLHCLLDPFAGHLFDVSSR